MDRVEVLKVVREEKDPGVHILRINFELNGAPYEVAFNADEIATRDDLRKKLSVWAIAALASPLEKLDLTPTMAGGFDVEAP